MENEVTEAAMEEQEISLLDLVAVIFRRKRIILLLTGAALVISVAFSLSHPNIYTATAKVLPPQKESVGVLSALSNIQGGKLAAIHPSSRFDGVS